MKNQCELLNSFDVFCIFSFVSQRRTTIRFTNDGTDYDFYSRKFKIRVGSIIFEAGSNVGIFASIWRFEKNVDRVFISTRRFI